MDLKKYVQTFKPHWEKIRDEFQMALETPPDQRTTNQIAIVAEVELWWEKLRHQVVGYLTRVIYTTEDGITAAIEEAEDYVAENWLDIVNEWDQEIEVPPESGEIERGPYEGYAKMYM